MANQKLVVLTAVGADRPGLVSALSALIHDHGANIEDSRMAVLGGEFAIVLLFSASPEAAAKLSAAKVKLGEQLGLTLFCRETQANEPKQRLAYRLQVTGLDHPGIVQRVSQVLSSFEINVATLDTSVVHAPMTGTPTFVLRADIDLPPEVVVNEVREALIAACVEDNLDCVLEARV